MSARPPSCSAGSEVARKSSRFALEGPDWVASFASTRCTLAHELAGWPVRKTSAPAVPIWRRFADGRVMKPWKVGNRIVGVDPDLRRMWVGGQRLHHGL